MIKAIIFDMDGVLIEAKDWHYEALNKALSLFGYEISRYDHLVTYDGLPTSKKLEMLSMERGLPRKLHKFINELKQQYTVDKIFTDCFPMFHHEYALAKLKSEGYKLAVRGGSSEELLRVALILVFITTIYFIISIFSFKKIKQLCVVNGTLEVF